MNVISAMCMCLAAKVQMAKIGCLAMTKEIRISVILRPTTSVFLLSTLGGFPLTISQLAGIIRRQDLTLSQFFELYADRKEHAGLYETKFDTNLATYSHTLSTV